MDFCVDAGSAEVGEACTWGEPGVFTGFDDCAEKLLCVGGSCRQICDVNSPDCTSSCETISEIEGIQWKYDRYGACVLDG